jgi:hypothetical protein
MSDANDGRRNFLLTALVSGGAVLAGLVAGSVARAKLMSDPLVREMSKRARTTSFENHGDTIAALCNKASCNPGCQDGCSAGCQAACKTGSK